MTPEEFNKVFAELEKMIGYPCPAPIKKTLWAKCKDQPFQYLKDRLTIYKFCWSEPEDLREAINRHTNS